MNKVGNQVGITPLPSPVEGNNLEGVPSLNGYLFHRTSTQYHPPKNFFFCFEWASFIGPVPTTKKVLLLKSSLKVVEIMHE